MLYFFLENCFVFKNIWMHITSARIFYNYWSTQSELKWRNLSFLITWNNNFDCMQIYALLHDLNFIMAYHALLFFNKFSEEHVSIWTLTVCQKLTIYQEKTQRGRGWNNWASCLIRKRRQRRHLLFEINTTSHYYKRLLKKYVKEICNFDKF